MAPSMIEAARDRSKGSDRTERQSPVEGVTMRPEKLSVVALRAASVTDDEAKAFLYGRY
jgi:hypothetical protein